MAPRIALAPLAPLIVLAVAGLQGCTGAAFGTAAAVGVTAAQERTVGDAVDDAVIHASINHELFQKDLKLFGAVSIDVVEGRVLLTGSVPQPGNRVEAVRHAWQADGVKEVINEIQVTDKAGLLNYARDTWISTQVKAKLLFDREIGAINYNVETVNGVVYMIGIARDQAELERAANHARTIRHVRKVVSHVRLKGAPPG